MRRQHLTLVGLLADMFYIGGKAAELTLLM